MVRPYCAQTHPARRLQCDQSLKITKPPNRPVFCGYLPCTWTYEGELNLITGPAWKGDWQHTVEPQSGFHHGQNHWGLCHWHLLQGCGQTQSMWGCYFWVGYPSLNPSGQAVGEDDGHEVQEALTGHRTHKDKLKTFWALIGDAGAGDTTGLESFADSFPRLTKWASRPATMVCLTFKEGSLPPYSSLRYVKQSVVHAVLEQFRIENLGQ